jgi:hypothetical protein
LWNIHGELTLCASSLFGGMHRTLGGDAICRTAIAAGWADGLMHSPVSKVECAKLIEKLPSYARGASKCIVKVYPNAKKP